MRIAVCDDLREELERTKAILAHWQREKRASVQVELFDSASAMLDASREKAFDLYLLDIMMPGVDGLAAAREIRQFNTAADIVFLTTSPGFAYESYSVHALDYLLKPVQEKNLFPLLDRLLLRQQKPAEGLTVKSGSTLVRVLFSRLSYVEVSSKHLYFSMNDGTVHEVFGTLREYEAPLLSRQEFARCHRSYIVNLLQIAELSPKELRTFTGKTLPVSRNLYPQLQKSYMSLLFSEGEE